MAQRYVSNKNESVRMFQSDLLEFCTHIHPVTPLIIYVPITAWMIYLAGQRGLSALAIAALVVCGIAIWSLVEYTMHRFVFHYEPKSSWGKRLHFMVHGVHHDYPQDASRLVMAPIVSLPLAAIFYGLFYLIFGQHTPAAFAGLLIGYLFYDMLHYATHHLPMKSGVWLFLKRYHLRHHYQDDHAGYGVSSPVWDHIFGTTSERGQKPAVGAALQKPHRDEDGVHRDEDEGEEQVDAVKANEHTDRETAGVVAK
jgi:sterol desaturase/sphingolipid hydroxylase (fatty acid hydroxylase superfamily)